MILMTWSRLSRATSRPSRMWALVSALSSSNLVRRMTISFWKATYALSISGRVSVRGTPPTRAMLMIPKVVCIWVCL